MYVTLKYLVHAVDEKRTPWLKLISFVVIWAGIFIVALLKGQHEFVFVINVLQEERVRRRLSVSSVEV